MNIQKTRAQVKRELKDMEIELEKLRDQLKELDKELGPHELARDMHDALCKENHTDGCSWGYEVGWDQSAHRMWLSKAKRLTQILPGLNNKERLAVVKSAL